MLMPPQAKAAESQPYYLQIYHYYRELILLGDIPQQTKLPSIRALAQHLGISRNPVENAYAHLVAEGYLINLPKSGYVAAPLLQIPEARGDARAAGSSQQQNGETSETSIPRNSKAAPMLDFAYDRIGHDVFPLRIWNKLTGQTLREAGAELLDYGDPKGEPQLRALIQTHVRQNRGVVCTAEQILITSGTQQSASMIALLLRGEEGEFGVEGAMHPGLRRVFQQQLHSLVPLPLELDGISCEAVQDWPTQLCGLYVTPSHQFPYGHILSAAKRTRLLQWASSTGSWLIEDDYDSEFLYDRQPLPALQGMDRAGRVIYMGTFSKALAPALRLSYLILPPELLARYERDCSKYDNSASRLTQMTMARFMEAGHLERHLRRMRIRYRENRNLLLAAVGRHFHNHAELTGCSSGLHAILQLRTSRSTGELVERAEHAGVRIRPTTDFHVSARAAAVCNREDVLSFVLGYGGLTGEQIEEGIRRLARAWSVIAGGNSTS